MLLCLFKDLYKLIQGKKKIIALSIDTYLEFIEKRYNLHFFSLFYE